MKRGGGGYQTFEGIKTILNEVNSIRKSKGRSIHS